LLVVVVLFHDHGSRYVGKMFNDDWMRAQGFVEDKLTNAADLIKEHKKRTLVNVRTEELVSHAIERMRKYQISQIPVIDSSGFVGSVDEGSLLKLYFSDKNIADKPIKEVMQKPFPVINLNTNIEKITKLMNKGNQAILVTLENGEYDIITKHDIVSAIH